MKIFFPTSFGPKTNHYSGEDLLFCFGLHIFLGLKPTNLTAMTFFFAFTYFWTEKGWHHENPAPGATIPSNATNLNHRSPAPETNSLPLDQLAGNKPLLIQNLSPCKIEKLLLTRVLWKRLVLSIALRWWSDCSLLLAASVPVLCSGKVWWWRPQSFSQAWFCRQKLRH